MILNRVNSECDEAVCLDCFKIAAVLISHAISCSSKTTSALGRDAVSIALALETGTEVGREEFGGLSECDIDKQSRVCRCSFGPFPSEINLDPLELIWSRRSITISKPELERLTAACGNVAPLSRSFWGAKRARGRTPSEWHGAFVLGLKVAATHCTLTSGCSGQSMTWDNTPLLATELKNRGFRMVRPV